MNSSTSDTSNLDAPLESESLDEFVEALPNPDVTQTKDVSFAPLAQLYGYHSPTPEQSGQLEFIWDYFAQEHVGRGDTLGAIRECERQLGMPELGQTRLNKLYNYVRILANVSDLEKERLAYLKEKDDSQN